MKPAKSTLIQILGFCIINTIVEVKTADVQLKSHTDHYDITAIYDARPDEYNINEKSDRKVEIHLMTNAIGMPIEFDGRILSSGKKSLEFIADDKFESNIFTRNTVLYDSTQWTISTLSMPNTFSTSVNYNLLLWKADNNEESFKIKWTQNSTIPTKCISVSYILEDSSKCSLSMDVMGQDYKELSYDFEQADRLTTVVIKIDDLFLNTLNYSLNLKVEKKHSYSEEYYEYKTEYANDCKFGIKRIASCEDEYENEEIFTIAEKEIQTIKFNVYPFGNNPTLISNTKSSSSLTCLNGGFAHQDKCLCPPGFKGNNCSDACGPNTFGTDCSGMCSLHQTQCQQKKLCTNSFGCICPAGYSGQYCVTTCDRGTYGVDCNQKCPNKCNNGACDIYTGTCTEGCKPSYISPNCSEKYQWFINAPQLLSESSTFTSLKLQLNLNPENINGSSTKNSVYYQIIFKPTLKEVEFNYTELVEIEQQTTANVTIEDLQPGITYTIGAILISEDGNYNSEDIRMVNYSTSCKQPDSTDYDVNLTSGIDYINVTWNELNSQIENNCKINEYILKLTFNDMENKQKSYSEEVKTKNNDGYIFKNLLSGRKYAVMVTTISASGQTETLKTSYISTHSNAFVKIKNIKAQLLNNQSSVLITWDIDDDMKYENPITYLVKFKVNKYFSCSHKIVENNWTSVVVHNQTKREIWDLIPNTQYIVKVESEVKGSMCNDLNNDLNDTKNVIFFKTAKSTPKLTPVYDDRYSNVTNHTASFIWTINTNECVKLNGLFMGYHITLKNIVDGTQTVSTSKQNTVSYDSLESNTKYELRVYVKTNFGFNSEQALVIPFKTKSKLLVAVKDLMVYKKNLKEKSFGIRWSFPDEFNNTFDGFIITAVSNNKTIGYSITKEITVKPEKCTAWPLFYCGTLTYLKTNIQYQINVKAKSQDYPTGGLSASTVGDFNDGISDKPGNLKATDIGSNHIKLEWDIPWIFNGVLKSFIVNTQEIASKNSSECCDSKPDVEIPITEEIPTYNYTINDLKSGSTYSIGVLSKTMSYGQTNRIHVTTVECTDCWSANTIFII